MFHIISATVLLAALPICAAMSQTVDPSTLRGKFLFGYQGWFSSTQDGDPYSAASHTDMHWSQWGEGLPNAGNVTVDMWPDTTAYPSKLLYGTGFQTGGKRVAQIYSAYDAATVDLHFKWMRDYGLDGAVAQRFVGHIVGGDPPALNAEIDQVERNVRASAEKYGRVFALEFDCSICTSATVVQTIEQQWAYVTDTLKLTSSPNYLHQNGAPVLFLYGFGIIPYPTLGVPAQALDVLNWFHHGPARYRATIVGQTCIGWRKLAQGCLTDPGWAAVYRAYDVISPWFVGGWASPAGGDSNWINTIKGDIDATAVNGQGYMPVLWPGFSAYNLERLRGLNAYSNAIPRNGGQLWWRQIYDYLGSDPAHRIRMAYGAMFDEVDEGTAMYKLAPTQNDVPNGGLAKFVSLDSDGYALPSDWYLQLANCATSALHGAFVPGPTIPITPPGAAPGCS
jgi:hypothetical protein